MNPKKYRELERLVRQLVLPADNGLRLGQNLAENFDGIYRKSQEYRDIIFSRQKLTEIKSLLQEEPSVETKYKDQKLFE